MRGVTPTDASILENLNQIEAKKKNPNFGNFWTFYIDLKKILAINCKRRLYIFCPIQSGFEISLHKASRVNGGGVHRTQPFPRQSWSDTEPV